MRSRQARILRLAGGVLVALLCSVRCSVVVDPEPLQRFETCNDLQLYLEDQILHPSVVSNTASGGVLVDCAGADTLDAVPGGAKGIGGNDGARTFTTTNTQEVNVDEPDFVKNDGDVIFVLRRGEMLIVSAWPAEDAHVLSSTPIDGVPFTMLFDADDGRALVVSRTFSTRAQTLLKIFDVANPEAPVELRSTTIDGDFVDARSVDHKVMLVTRSALSVNVALDSAPFADDDNRARLHAAGLGALLPKVTDFIDGQDDAPRVDNAAGCENTYAPSRSDGRSILLIHGLDLADPTAALASTAVVAGFSNVYASTSSLYLASTETSDGGYFTPDFATTRLHKLDAFTGDGAAEYKATGVFTGRIKDELSLDEGPDHSLRMVITDDSTSADTAQQTTSLVVLAEKGTALTEVARVDDIGRGEQVESVRFLGDKAYLVTYPAQSALSFNQDGLPSVPFADPLHVIDLSDAKNPELRGSIALGGYAAYIHPIDDGHILTVGVDTDATTGALTALSLALFDVSDADHPALVFRTDIGDANTGSEALVDRHAFTYFAEQGAFAIPVTRFDPDTGALLSSALAVFAVDVDAGTITARGEIEQQGLFAHFTNADSNAGVCASIRRSVMISDPLLGTFVYAISSAGLTAAHLQDELPTAAVVNLAVGDDSACDAAGGPL